MEPSQSKPAKSKRRMPAPRSTAATGPSPIAATTALEQAAAQRSIQRYELRLYVAGLTPRSVRAIHNIRTICEKHLHDRYDLLVVDIYQQPVLAEGEQIVAAPTLIKKLPLPLRRFIGDMSNTERILVGMDLRETSPS
jgi:circadian clock protein KaiB